MYVIRWDVVDRGQFQTGVAELKVGELPLPLCESLLGFLQLGFVGFLAFLVGLHNRFGLTQFGAVPRRFAAQLGDFGFVVLLGPRRRLRLFCGRCGLFRSLSCWLRIRFWCWCCVLFGH
ncbi:hypothetical protein A5646_03520 [Mycobacterium sp. 1245499.0]|nr:hypothetical protein A5646_03520 [Mycobacterium sp. 1245499.0]